MERLILPRENSEYVPTGIYCCQQEERKAAFLNLFPKDDVDYAINERRIENLKELRGDYR